jgi:hypothetical protein
LNKIWFYLWFSPKEIAKTLKNEEKSDKIAVAEIENKTIKSIQYLSTEDELIKALN